MHSHQHQHSGHSHHGESGGSRLLIAIILNSIITVTEYVAGLLSGSLALISDAGHNFSDVLALILGYAGEKAGEREPDARYSFGFRRAEVLIALVNSLSLIMIGAYVVYEAVERFRNPAEISAGIMIPVALVGLFGNLFSILVLNRDRERNLNMRAAFLHLFYDALSSLAVVAVGIVLLFKAWLWLDLVASLVIVAMLVWSSIGIIAESMRVIMQAAPGNIDPHETLRRIAAVPGVAQVHGLHIWSVNSSEVFLSCHICVSDEVADTDEIIRRVNAELQQFFGIRHTAIQIESVNLCSEKHGVGCCPET